MTNNTAVANETLPDCSWLPSEQELVVYIALNLTFACFTIISNCIFLSAVAKTPHLQTVSNFFLCSLSLADLSAGLFVFPLYSAVVLLGVSPSGLWLSKVEKFVWIQTLVSSTFSLALVSVDRYVAVLYPLKYYTTVTEERCLHSIIFVWVLSIILGFPAPFLDETGVAIIWAVGGVIAVVIPFAVISFCYFHIFKAVRQQSKRVHSQESAMTSHVLSNAANSDVIGGICESVRRMNPHRHQKAAITTSIIVGLFVVLFTPNFVFAFLYAIKEEGSCEQIEILHPWLWGVMVAYSGSFVNPWIYGLRTREFKNVLKQMIKCG